MVNVLLLGLKGIVVEDAERQLDLSGIKLFTGTGLDDLRAAFAEAEIDHVVMGAGIDLETRLALVREVFQLSEKTTVHLKDRASGPTAFLAFARSVLSGLRGYGG